MKVPKQLPWYKRMKVCRDILSLTQTEAAQRCGVSRMTYYRWEAGRSVPIPVYREKISVALEAKPSDIFVGKCRRKSELAVKKSP